MKAFLYMKRFGEESSKKNKAPIPANALSFLPLLKHFINSPDFRLKDGSIEERLNYAYFQSMGGVQYPPFLVVAKLAKLLENWHLEVHVQNLIIKIVKKPVYEISADVAIMSQDIYKVVGPVDELDLEEENVDDEAIEELIEKLRLDYIASQAGDILIRSPEWCKSPHLLEAIIYRFEEEEITDEETIRTILPQLFKEASRFSPKKIAMDPLGTEYHTLPPKVFAKIFFEALQNKAREFPHLQEIVITARNEKQAKMLKQAFGDVLR